MKSRSKDSAGGASKQLQDGSQLGDTLYHRLRGSEFEASASNFFEVEAAACTPFVQCEGAGLDLDTFFQRVYRFYADRGFANLTIRWVAELLVVGFTIAFSGFLVLVVDWPRLLSAKCGGHRGGDLPGCDLFKEALREHPLRPFTLGKMFFVCYMALLLLYWCFCFAKFFYQLRGNLEIRHFVHTRLGISEKELQTMSWPSLVDKIVNWHRQASQVCRVKPRLSAHDIVSRIMRKENYLIGMLNKGVLAVDLPPSDRPVGQVRGRRARPLVLTKMVEWSLDWCIFQHMFDSNSLIRGDFASEPARLRKRLKVLGVVMLAASPFYLLFMVFCFALWNAESFYRNPAARSLRGWSNSAAWSFREFNELEHMFKQRLNSSYKPALEYVKQFPSHATSTVAKAVSYIVGAFAALILLLYVIDPSLLEGHIGGHNLLWYEFLFGAILACSRALIADDSGHVFDPVAIMRRVSLHTHYLPKHWRGAENVEIVRSEFQKMFKIKAVLFVEEILAIFVAPYVLIFELPECVDDLLQFVQDFTVHVEGVGHVCSLSVFDFEQHGNSKYGSSFNASKHRRSSQGKMEKSFLSFKTNYPNWEPNGVGKQLMSTLERPSRLQTCNEENQGLDTAITGHGIPGKNPLLNTRRPAGSFQRESNFVHIIDMSGWEYSYLQRPENNAVEQMDLLDKFYTLAPTQSPPPQNHLNLAGDACFTSAGKGDLRNRVAGASLRDSEPQDGTRWWDRQQNSRGPADQSFLEPPAFAENRRHDKRSLPDSPRGPADRARALAEPPLELLAAENDGRVKFAESGISYAFNGGGDGYRPYPMRSWVMYRRASEAGSQVLQDDDGRGSVLEFPFADAFERDEER